MGAAIQPNCFVTKRLVSFLQAVYINKYSNFENPHIRTGRRTRLNGSDIESQKIPSARSKFSVLVDDGTSAVAQGSYFSFISYGQYGNSPISNRQIAILSVVQQSWNTEFISECLF